MPTYVKPMRERESDDTIIGSQIVRRYRVMGTDTEADTYNAIDSVTSLRVPRRTETLDTDARYVVIARAADWDNYSQEYGNVWIVRVIYQKPQFDLVENSLEWAWDHELVSVPASSDYYGRPLLNAAGDPLIGTYPKTMIAHTLHVFFNAVYSPGAAVAVLNKVNSASLTVFPGGADSFTAEQANMLCRGFRPVNPMTAQGQVQRIQATFSFLDGDYPWFFHAANQGYNARYTNGTDSGTYFGRIHARNNALPVEEPVQLNALGVPVYSTLYGATQSLYTFLNNADVPAHVVYRNEPDTDTFEAIFETLGNYDFTGFLAGVM